MNKKKIPMIVGLLILIVSLALGVSLISYRQVFKIGAGGEASPKDVRISNISDSSFTISWTTDKASLGAIKYGLKESSLESIEKEEVDIESFTHLSKITGLKANTAYFFKVVSGGKDYDNNGVLWQIKTAPPIAEPKQNIIVSGNILTSTGNPATNAIVYISVGGNLLSTLTSQNGSWLIPVSYSRTTDLSSYVEIDPSTTLLEITVQSGQNEITTAQIYPQSANPTPTMILGQVYDFKNNPPSQTNDLPGSSLEAPEGKSQQSGFNIPNDIATPSAQVVTLESVDEGEVVNTTSPEFFGEGPANANLTITVESDPVTTDGIQIPQSGQWKWTPPQGLSEGSHKITLSWKDAQGITRSLIRNFVVKASEGPAFEATPSATLKASPSATPKVSPTLTASPSATLPPVPESGVLTPTLILSIMGMGVIAFSVFLWKKVEV
ncbi:MAG: Ig-like domain-containing protein [bacterium]|nr:Ig-like domain-containing protein [bacterium]MDZ4209926.1 Ig-like domain-containing protein [Candidatus Curtissbacteria bacterium]